MKKIGNSLLSFFIAGILTIVIFALIFYIISLSGFIIDLKQIFQLAVDWINSALRIRLSVEIPFWLPVVEVIFLIEVIGFVAFETNFLNTKNTTSSIIWFLFRMKKLKPVAVQYPRPGIWKIGFNQGELEWIDENGKVEEKVKIFIPSHPIPGTAEGCAIMHKWEVFEVDISRTELIHYIMTGGLSLKRIRIKGRLSEKK